MVLIEVSFYFHFLAQMKIKVVESCWYCLQLSPSTHCKTRSQVLHCSWGCDFLLFVIITSKVSQRSQSIFMISLITTISFEHWIPLCSPYQHLYLKRSLHLANHHYDHMFSSCLHLATHLSYLGENSYWSRYYVVDHNY